MVHSLTLTGPIGLDVAAAYEGRSKADLAPVRDISGMARPLTDGCSFDADACRHGIERTLLTDWAFFAVLTDEQVAALRADPHVEYVEEPCLM
jgi:hypothetical protein